MRLIDANALMDYCNNLVDKTIDANDIARFPTAYGWISVNDGMPEERESLFAKFKGTSQWQNTMFERMSDDVRVAVTFTDGTRMVRHGYTVDGKWNVEKKVPSCVVTHWMPNPELPEVNDD